MKTRIRKWLGSTGLFNYCRHCGKDKTFNDEKYELVYKVRSECDCDNPVGMVRRVWFR